jgi:hypothetical protein
MISVSKMMEDDMEQFTWHEKPKGWKVCPICGCDNVRAGVVHRALTAPESWDWKVLWVKRISVCFGTDISIEPIQAKQ